MRLPGFSTSASKSVRELMSVENFDAVRDLFIIKMLTVGDQLVDLELSVDLIDWTERQVLMKFNFTNPLVISAGL